MTAMPATGHDTAVKDSIPFYSGAPPPNLTSAHVATAIARTPGQSPAIISTHRFPAPISRTISFKGKAMPAVHYYLGRPARVWISAQSPRSPARQAHRQRTRPQRHPRPARNRIHPFCARRGARPSRYPPALRRQPDGLRDRGTRPSPRAAARPAGHLEPGRLTRPCPQAYPRPGNAPRPTSGYASGTRSCTWPSWPNCTSCWYRCREAACPYRTAFRRPTPHGLHITHPGTPRRSDAYDPPVVHLGRVRVR